MNIRSIWSLWPGGRKVVKRARDTHMCAQVCVHRWVHVYTCKCVHRWVCTQVCVHRWVHVCTGECVCAQVSICVQKLWLGKGSQSFLCLMKGIYNFSGAYVYMFLQNNWDKRDQVRKCTVNNYCKSTGVQETCYKWHVKWSVWLLWKIVMLFYEEVCTWALPIENTEFYLFLKQVHETWTLLGRQTPGTLSQTHLALFGFISLVLWSWKVYGQIVSHRVSLIFSMGTTHLISHFIQDKWKGIRRHLADFVPR
jgi:hypothetical protein